jgi:hypothetical protein
MSYYTVTSKPYISNTPIPPGRDGTPSLEAEKAINKREKAEAKVSDELARQLERKLNIDETQQHTPNHRQ